MRLKKVCFCFCLLQLMNPAYGFSEKSAFDGVVYGTSSAHAPDYWCFSKDDPGSLSNAIQIARDLGNNKLDELIKKNNNPDFVAIRYFIAWQYPSIEFIWIKNDIVEGFSPYSEFTVEVIAKEPQSLYSWVEYWKSSIKPDRLPPRLASAIENSYLKVKQLALSKKRKMLDELKTHLESHQMDLKYLKAKAMANADKTFIFKSFYIGMPIEDAALLLDIQLELHPDNSISEMVCINKNTDRKSLASHRGLETGTPPPFPR